MEIRAYAVEQASALLRRLVWQWTCRQRNDAGRRQGKAGRAALPPTRGSGKAGRGLAGREKQ